MVYRQAEPRLSSRFKNLRLSIHHCLAYDVDWLHWTDYSNRTDSILTGPKLNLVFPIQNQLPNILIWFFGSSFQFFGS